MKDHTPTSGLPLQTHAATDFNQTWYVSYITLKDYTYAFIHERLHVKVGFVRYA